MNFTPTPEQTAIVSAARDTKDNLLIGALAGAAKTSTLELVAAALPDVNAICLAFNKKIADEMRAKLPSGYSVKTLHSLGLSIWTNAIGKRCKVDNGKVYKILRTQIEAMPRDEQEEAWKHSSYILKAIGQLKGAGYIPNSCVDKKTTPLLDDDTFPEALDEELSAIEHELIHACSEISFHQAMQGIIDYDDMVLMPSVCKAPYPIHSLILVDEAQDLSPLNHLMLKRLYRRRIIAVGDSCQAIYAFRGADEAGMSSIMKLFDCKPMSLSTSFRCPEAIVEHVKWRAEHMVAWSGNPKNGLVKTLDRWSFDDIPDDSAIICRNNAPLFSLAVKLFKQGRYPNLWGSDLGKGLLSVMKKLGPNNMKQEDALKALLQYENEQAQRVKNLGALRDRVDCIDIFLREKPTLGEAKAHAENLLASSGRVHFMTGHKSKGHEFDNVFFLDQALVSTEGQDPNLRYVICTRSKDNLTYVTTENFIDEN